MKKTWLLATALVPFTLALPARGDTASYPYPDSCKIVWSAVKDALSSKDLYSVKSVDNAGFGAVYMPKHPEHVDLTGVFVAKDNQVHLAAKGDGCEIQVVSNYSGWKNDDAGNFKKRVEASLLKVKAGHPTQEPVLYVAPPKAPPSKTRTK